MKSNDRKYVATLIVGVQVVEKIFFSKDSEAIERAQSLDGMFLALQPYDSLAHSHLDQSEGALRWKNN